LKKGKTKQILPHRVLACLRQAAIGGILLPPQLEVTICDQFFLFFIYKLKHKIFVFLSDGCACLPRQALAWSQTGAF
jgi:hypothetical protein